MRKPSVPRGHYSYLASSCLSFLTRNRCPSFPSRIHLQTQTRCNARCAICPHPRVSPEWRHGTMEWSLFDDITRQIGLESNASTVIFDLQNEPLLNPDIFTWIRHMKAHSPASKCVLITNGSLLDRFEVADIEASQVDLIAVSLNAHSREVYEQLNCGLQYNTIVENVIRLTEIAALRSRLRVDFVTTECNRGELRKARDVWRDRGVRTFCKPLHNRAGALDDYGSLRPSRKDGTGITSAVRAVARRRIGCALPFYQMNVLHDGDAILCCHDWAHARIVGTASRQSLRDIWNSPTLQSIRRSLVSGKVRDATPCRDCSLASV